MLERYNSFLEFRNFKEYDRIEIYQLLVIQIILIQI